VLLDRFHIYHERDTSEDQSHETDRRTKINLREECGASSASERLKHKTAEIRRRIKVGNVKPGQQLVKREKKTKMNQAGEVGE